MANLLVVMAIAAMVIPDGNAADAGGKGGHRNKTNFIYSEKDNEEHPEGNNTSKLLVEGGMFID